jgi:hypothetical protein
MIEDLMAMSSENEFASVVSRLIQERSCRRLIETGTYHGLGSTSFVAGALKSAGLTDSKFFSIEVDPENASKARKNLSAAGLSDYVTIIVGLSLLRSQLKDPAGIERELDGQKWPMEVYLDHEPAVRAECFYKESNFPKERDGLLLDSIHAFDDRPDFVLLDSAGHLGWMEFRTVVDNAKGNCILVLDDIKHCKHYRSHQEILSDPRFKVLAVTDDRFGSIATEFAP